MTYTIKASNGSLSITDNYTMTQHIKDKYERMGLLVQIKESE